MKLGRSEAIIALILVLFFLTGVYFYPQMPEMIASHWNARGQADDYMSRFWGLFLLPVISLGLTLLLMIAPRIDPLKANIGQFKRYYDLFVIVLLLFMFYLYLLTIFWNLGFRFNMVQLLVPGFSVLFYIIGEVMQKARRNWFIGIRTPWTMSSDRVWDATHQLGGRLFKAGAVISLLGILFQRYAIFFVIGPAVLVAVFTMVYSYLEYRKEARI